MMINLHYLSTVTFFLATIGCASLALAIYRRAERNSEVRVLLLMLLLFSLYSSVLFCDVLSFGVLKILPLRTSQIVAAVALAVQILFFASVCHFLVLTHRRVLSESGELSDPFSPYRGYGNRWFFRFNVSMFYFLALTIIVKTAHAFLKSMRANPDGFSSLPDVFPPVPQVVNLLLGMLIFLVPQITLNAYRISAGGKLPRFIGTMFGPYFRTLPQPENILRLSYTRRDQMPPRREVWPEKPTPWLPKAAQPLVFRTAGVEPRPTSKDEWRAVQTIALWMLTSVPVALYFRSPLSLDRVSSLTWYALPAPFVTALVYFKMRFVFFDVLIKRGLITGAFLVSSAIYFGILLGPVQRSVELANATAFPIVLYAGCILFLIVWMACYGRLNALLNRHLFRRPDYRKAAAELGELMKQFVEADALIGMVTDRLSSDVGAEAIRFIPGDHSAGEMAASDSPVLLGPAQRQLSTVRIPLHASDRIFGYLDFGKRRGGFRYQSEDLAFLTTIAGQLAGMLHNFELRSEREAQEQREGKLRALAAQAELRALRAQINPHFLFNALNSLSDLTQEDPQAAESAILNLSHVFRYALDASRRESVTLGEEMDFLRSYLEVESLRFEDRLQFEVSASQDARVICIPPMLIQPLVENAVKYGISGRIDAGRIHISALLEDDTLHIEVSDNGPGIDPGMDQGERGIGLKNVRARLQHIAGAGSLRINSPPGGGTVVSFDLPALRESDRKDTKQ